jgi:hypothetical protein
MESRSIVVYGGSVIVFILLLIKLYVLAELSTVSYELYITQQQTKEMQRENILLEDEYLTRTSYGYLYWEAQKEQGFRPATDKDYYLLK